MLMSGYIYFKSSLFNNSWASSNLHFLPKDFTNFTKEANCCLSEEFSALRYNPSTFYDFSSLTIVACVSKAGISNPPDLEIIFPC